MMAGYFWDKHLSEDEVRAILRDPKDKRFTRFAAQLLHRAPANEVFNWLSKELFCRRWYGIKHRLKKDAWAAEDLGYWEKVYAILKKELKEQGVMIRQPVKPRSSFLAMIGRRLKTARSSQRLSQAALAQQIGMKQVNISRIESGQENVTLLTLQRIAEALALEICLEGGTETKQAV